MRVSKIGVWVSRRCGSRRRWVSSNRQQSALVAWVSRMDLGVQDSSGMDADRGCFFSDPPSDRVFQSGRAVGRESSSRGRR